MVAQLFFAFHPGLWRVVVLVVEKQISELPLGLTTNLRIAFRRHVSRLVGLVGARARVNGLSVACALSNSHVRMCAILVLQYMES